MEPVMYLFTDYPLQWKEFHKKAPVRRVKVLSYDHDKYVKVEHIDFGIHEIKAGYLYEKEGRFGEVDQVDLQKLIDNVPRTISD